MRLSSERLPLVVEVFFFFIFIWLSLTEFVNSESLSDVYAKECSGTAEKMTVIGGNSIERYERYRSMYEKCTYVRGNLEIVSLDLTDERYDLSFLEDVREVDGYVLIFSNFLTKIRLRRLRVIRGLALYDGEFSLYVELNSAANNRSIGLQELQLPSLVEILEGKVLFKGNARLCFGEKTIDWNHILLNNEHKSVEFSNISGHEKIECQSHMNCHENCTAVDGRRYCWGSGADMCQTIHKCNGCPKRRCSENNICCDEECAAGCNGHKKQTEQCLSCRNFVRGLSKCVESCSKASIVNTLGGWKMKVPEDKYAQGSKCVNQCAAGFVLQDEFCVQTCKDRYMVNDSVCVPCPGTCPKTCEGTERWLNKALLPSYSNCIKVVGNLDIYSQTFTWHQESETISVADLEMLSSIEEITGTLTIQAWNREFTSLNFLRNLRTIGGVGSSHSKSALDIVGTSLKSLELKSLQKVEGEVYIVDNADLCYAGEINWTKIATGEIDVNNNKNQSICGDEGFVCSSMCLQSHGCMGPDSDSCITCRYVKLLDGHCSSNCSTQDGFYVRQGIRGNSECRPCNEQCDGSCSGDGPEHCNKCKYVIHNKVCVVKCPSQTYQDADGICQQCNSLCNECTGNSSALDKKSGCNTCINNTIRYHNATHRYCISSVKECNESLYYIVDSNPVKTCHRCHPECNGCTVAAGPSNCMKCRHFRQNKTEGISECVASCPEYFYDAKNGECQRCHPECPTCFGPTAYDCHRCRNVRIYGADSSLESTGDVHNDTLGLYKSYCAEDCHAGQTKEKGNATDSTCKTKPNDDSWISAIVVPIFVVLFLIIVVGSVIFILFWRKQRTKRLEEELLIDLIPSKAKPNMASLRLIKESELRRGNTIGSGAFGTVYKGIWIPEKENVKIPVAIKVLQDNSNTNLNVELLDEARIMASVCHPNCVRILAVCMTAQMMLVTQLMPLGCLLDYVRKEKPNIGSRALLLWSVQIAKGMQYLEELGIIHRDLAARNVLVHNPNEAKITDFGLAKLLDYEEAEIHSEGEKMPIKWMALECIHARIYSHKSDVWSYGVTLWEMFSYGDRPYENILARQVPQALEKGERLPQPTICTLDVYTILIKCWMLDVDSRPTFSDLVDEFARMAADPGRFLVIPGDKLMRLPSQTPDHGDLFRLMSLPMDDPDLTIISADEYLRPMELESEDSDGVSPLMSMERGRRLAKIEEDGAELKSFAKQLSRQCSENRSQRYISDPCHLNDDPGGGGGGCGGGGGGPECKGIDYSDEASQSFPVDEEGYLCTQPLNFQPPYLDLIYQTASETPETDEVISNIGADRINSDWQKLTKN